MNPGAEASGGRALLIGRLLRLSLAPTALADPLVGAFLSGGLFLLGPRAFLLPVASACVYHGAMALNDWADREHDARTRPDRPLPSGRVDPGTALLLAAGLMTIGPIVAWFAFGWVPALVLTAAALLAGLYDVAGRGPRLGPSLLGACRFTNVLFGAVAATAATPVAFESQLLLAPLVYAGYVFLVSRLGRLEDDLDREPGQAPRPLLIAIGSTLVLAAPIGFLSASSAHPHASPWSLLGPLIGFGLAFKAASQPLREARTKLDWSHGDVERAVGASLRRLLIFQAAVVLGVGSLAGLGVAGLILLGYPLASRLRSVFPPS